MVLIDSPIIAGWRAATLGVIKSTPLVGRLTPGAVSRQRRNHWPSVEAALEHFAHKRAFAHWDPQSLRDYIEYGTEEIDGQRWLRFDRAIETAIYNTVPDNMERLLQRRPLKCPVAFIGGTRSLELRQVGMATTERITHGRVAMLEGTHLLPMEKPVAVAAAVESAIRGMER